MGKVCVYRIGNKLVTNVKPDRATVKAQLKRINEMFEKAETKDKD